MDLAKTITGEEWDALPDDETRAKYGPRQAGKFFELIEQPPPKPLPFWKTANGVRVVLSDVEYSQLPPSLKKEWKPRANGRGFVLDVEGFDDLANVVSAHEKLTRENLERQAKIESLETEVKRYSDGWKELVAYFDGDETKARDVLERHKRGEPLLDPFDVEAERAALEKTFADERAALDAEIAEAQAQLKARNEQLEGLAVDDALKSAIAKQRGDVKLLLPHVRERVAILRDDSGVMTGVGVKDSLGNVRLDARGLPIPVEQLVAELRLLYPSFGAAFVDDPPNGKAH